jgi:ubiquinone/menaquinone biosynthesis C-methylase UbiE
VAELRYSDEAAAGYDALMRRMAARFAPLLIRAARLAPGQRVLDIATGTGLAAEPALAAVAPTGRVTAADVAPAMIAKARERLGARADLALLVADGQALPFAEASFDALLCSLGLMFFPDPAQGLSEFRRVLRTGGRAAVSVNTVPERSLNARVSAAIGRRVPALAEATARVFSLGDAARLRSLVEAAGFGEVETFAEARRFTFASFDAFFGPIERGGTSSGQAFIALPEDVRRAVREEVRRDLNDAGGPVEVEVEIRFAGGVRR